MFSLRKKTLTFLIASSIPFSALGQEVDNIMAHLSLKDLLSIKVVSASGVEESAGDAPASLVVITKDQIKNRGYTTLDQIFLDLPGFDTYVNHTSRYMNVYQRGYRTPITSRTLFLINGNVQNDLWTHVPHMQRQIPMSNVQRIEVLYGPVGVIYGPNAFLGIVNVITDDGSNVIEGEREANVAVSYGSYDTKDVDIGIRGKEGKLKYAVSAKLHDTPGPDLDDFNSEWGFMNEEWLNDESIWGPILDVENEGRETGKYNEHANNYGVLAELTYDELKLSYLDWTLDEGYGHTYAADKGQPAGAWKKSGKQVGLTHESELEEGFSVKSKLLKRHSRVWGTWIEASPDPDDNNFSRVSVSDWNTVNSATLFEQNYTYDFHKNWLLTGGIKYESKRLTQAYDICGYWANASCSSISDSREADSGNLGLLGLGIGVQSSRDEEYFIVPGTTGIIPPDQIEKTEDTGAFVQGVYDGGGLMRLSLGFRTDNNSIYGTSSNPRATAIFRLNETNTLKLLYGEAFQEPPPIQLYGGWNGRNANPDLLPEELKNYELIYILQQSNWLHEISLYLTQFTNVVKEEALNAGDREVLGLEYRGRYHFGNFISESLSKVTGYIYYTYTDNESDIFYNHDEGAWQDGSTDIGDIAEHKVQVGINVPTTERLNINLRASYHGETEVYSRNPLRAQGDKLEAYTLVNLDAQYRILDRLSMNFSIDNLLDEDYFVPGAQAANSGNDFNATRSAGFFNSMIPGLGRSYMVSLNMRF